MKYKKKKHKKKNKPQSVSNLSVNPLKISLFLPHTLPLFFCSKCVPTKVILELWRAFTLSYFNWLVFSGYTKSIRGLQNHQCWCLCSASVRATISYNSQSCDWMRTSRTESDPEIHSPLRWTQNGWGRIKDSVAKLSAIHNVNDAASPLCSIVLQLHFLFN